MVRANYYVNFCTIKGRDAAHSVEPSTNPVLGPDEKAEFCGREALYLVLRVSDLSLGPKIASVAGSRQSGVLR